MIAVLARLVLAAVVLAAGLPAVADGTLRPLRTADDGRGREAVGRLTLGGGGFCTGSLVAPDVVLTAAHCLFDPATGARLDPDRLEFQAGLRLGRAEAYRRVRRAVIHPDYDPEASGATGGVGHDVALLKLDAPIRLARVRPFSTQAGIGPGETVSVVSYAQDRADAPSREAACDVLARDATVLVLSCDVAPGASGAPVLLQTGGAVRIVSVISAMAQWNGRAVALAPVPDGAFEAVGRAFTRTPPAAPVGKRLAVGAPAVGVRPAASP